MAGTRSPLDETSLGLIQSEQNRSDQAIQGAQIRGTPARTIEDQQLMFRENGFCDHGAHTAGPNDAHNRGEHMDKEDNHITHVRF